MLASNLIRSIAELDGETKLARIFEHMKEATVARYSSRMAGKPLRGRVAEMAKIMTGAGYMAEWEQLNRRTFQITEHNCAIARVAQQCQHACVCELSMFRELLQATVSRQEHLVAGDPCCRYIVQSRNARKPAKKPAKKRRWPSSRTRAVVSKLKCPLFRAHDMSGFAPYGVGFEHATWFFHTVVAIPDEAAFREHVRPFGRWQITQQATDNFFGMAQPVDRCRIDPVDAQFEGMSHGGQGVGIILRPPSKGPASASDRPGAKSNCCDIKSAGTQQASR